MINFELKYKSALGTATTMYACAKEKNDKEMVQSLELIFPELKESEDKRIKEEIIHLIKKSNEYGGYALHKDEADRMIAWLEKQGEQNPTEEVEPKFKVGNCIVEPKFKIGDWVVEISFPRCYYKIVELCESRYKVIDTKNSQCSISFKDEANFKLWTIQDAKDGDVLVCEDYGYTSLMLFESFSNGRISLYGWYNSQTNNFHINTDVALRKDANIHPATKEQRDLLFQKMKEAGYKWDDAEKKLVKLPTDKDNIIPDEKLLEVYEYLMNHKYGYLEDLNKIYPGLAQYLIKEGTIGEGVNAKLQLRYHVTKHGKKIARIQRRSLILKTLEYEKN